MAWTAPRTWTDTEVVTNAMMNAHLRDNQLVLKVCRDATGRVTDISSTTFASLASTNVTGLAVPTAGNAFSAGTSRFNQGAGARVVLPVGANKWTGTKGVDARGAWVEGTGLHHIAQDLTQEWSFVGVFVSTPGGAVHGSVWVAGSSLYYIDESGDKRRCDFVPDSVHADHADAPHTDASALGGSAWVKTYVHWVAEGGASEQPGHADVTHSDHADHTDHTDHTDSGPHSDHDDHGDVAGTPHDDHSDHADSGSPHVDHSDHVDHTDTGHADTTFHTDHTDHSDHTDHGDHGDSGAHTDHSDHSDGTPHSDVAADARPVTVA